MATSVTSNPISTNAPYIPPIDAPRVSLTEGTSIPPPLETNTSLGAADQLSPSGRGPLSSHPVTPVDGAGSSPFPTMNAANLNSAFIARSGTQEGFTMRTSADQNKLPVEDQYARAYDSAVAGPEPQVFAGALPPREADERNPRGRRPSMTSRFARLRSMSGMRRPGSRNGLANESTSNLSQNMMSANNGEPSTPDNATQRPRRSSIDGLKRALRGTKRPASPSAESTLNTPDSTLRSAPANGGSQSFPRMMRKRSMDLISNGTRRMSGMWSRQGPEDNGAMQAEVERERLRDEYNMNVVESRQGTLVGRTGSGLASPLREQYRRDRGIKQAPTPMLMPELATVFESHGTLDGEDMFKDIGR